VSVENPVLILKNSFGNVGIKSIFRVFKIIVIAIIDGINASIV
jgi:spore maturation protein SpmB